MASCSCFFRHQNVYLYIPNLIGERAALYLLDQYHRAPNVVSWIPTRVNIVCRLYAHRADPGSSRLRLQPPRALCGDLFPGVSDLWCGRSVDHRLLYVQGFCGTSNSSHLLFGCFVDGMILTRSAAQRSLAVDVHCKCRFVCDELDGRAARTFDQTSTFGAVLDMVTDRSAPAWSLINLKLSDLSALSLCKHCSNQPHAGKQWWLAPVAFNHCHSNLPDNRELVSRQRIIC